MDAAQRPEQRPASPPTPPPPTQANVFHWFLPIGFLFLTVAAVVLVYLPRYDSWALALVAFAYSELMLLLVCLKLLFRKLPPPTTEWMKTPACILATALNLAIAWRAAEIVQPMLAVAVAGLYGRFFYLHVIAHTGLSPEDNV